MCVTCIWVWDWQCEPVRLGCVCAVVCVCVCVTLCQSTCSFSFFSLASCRTGPSVGLIPLLWCFWVYWIPHQPTGVQTPSCDLVTHTIAAFELTELEVKFNEDPSHSALWEGKRERCHEREQGYDARVLLCALPVAGERPSRQWWHLLWYLSLCQWTPRKQELSAPDCPGLAGTW